MVISSSSDFRFSKLSQLTIGASTTVVRFSPATIEPTCGYSFTSAPIRERLSSSSKAVEAKADRVTSRTSSGDEGASKSRINSLSSNKRSRRRDPRLDSDSCSFSKTFKAVKKSDGFARRANSPTLFRQSQTIRSGCVCLSRSRRSKAPSSSASRFPFLKRAVIASIKRPDALGSSAKKSSVQRSPNCWQASSAKRGILPAGNASITTAIRFGSAGKIP